MPGSMDDPGMLTGLPFGLQLFVASRVTPFHGGELITRWRRRASEVRSGTRGGSLSPCWLPP